MSEHNIYSNTNKGYQTRLRIVPIARNSADIIANQTRVDWYFSITSNGATFNANTTAGVYVNGWVYELVTTRNMGGLYNTLQIASGTTTIPHEADGTKSFNASSYFWTINNSQSWSTGELRSSGTVTLSRIPRGPGRWNGSAWVPTIAERWNGSAWVPVIVERWNGSAWVVVTN